VTARDGGARRAPLARRPGALAGADQGAGARARVAAAAAPRAAVVRRIPPATVPREPAAAQPCAGLAWRRAAGGAAREWHGWCRWERPPSGGRRRVRRHAQKQGRTPSTPALGLAAWWLGGTTLAAAAGPAAAGLRLSRARWHVDLVGKRLPQLLRLKQRRRPPPTRVAATRRALRVAGALQEG
jgi:hypothetical protein